MNKIVRSSCTIFSISTREHCKSKKRVDPQSKIKSRTYLSFKLLMTYANNGWPIEIRQVSKLNCKATVAEKSPALGGDTAVAEASAGQ